MRKAQAWSMDIALGIIVFLAAFFLFYTLINANPNTKTTKLKDEASSIIREVASEDARLRIVDNEEVNVSKIAELKNLSYTDLQRRLRVEGDFCIYLEDDKGNIIIINNTYKGIGAPNINISGTPCSQK